LQFLEHDWIAGTRQFHLEVEFKDDGGSHKPYIYLPRSSCDAIAAKLPVSYNSDLGLYFWDTTSSQ